MIQCAANVQKYCVSHEKFQKRKADLAQQAVLLVRGLQVTMCLKLVFLCLSKQFQIKD